MKYNMITLRVLLKIYLRTQLMLLHFVFFFTVCEIIFSVCCCQNARKVKAISKIICDNTLCIGGNPVRDYIESSPSGPAHFLSTAVRNFHKLFQYGPTTIHPFENYSKPRCESVFSLSWSTMKVRRTILVITLPLNLIITKHVLNGIQHV